MSVLAKLRSEIATVLSPPQRRQGLPLRAGRLGAGLHVKSHEVVRGHETAHGRPALETAMVAAPIVWCSQPGRPVRRAAEVA